MREQYAMAIADKADNEPYDTRQVGWQQLPRWMKDNEFILTSYRKATYSYALSLRSTLHLHNETVNIWSHLLGTLLFAFSLYHFLTTSWPTLSTASTSDIFAVTIYYIGVVNCFVLSTGFHVFSNHSKEIHRFGNELDHIGVVLVIYGSTLPATYFEFYCHPRLQYFYWGISTLFASASAMFTLRPKFRHPAYRKVRFYMYTLLGLSVFFPVIHGLFLFDGYDELRERMSLSYLIGLGVLNFSGAAIYAARIPERWFPETFDLWGASHQIMHVLVVVGALSWESGLLRCVELYHEDGRALCKA
jgi:adiponectin receptor